LLSLVSFLQNYQTSKIFGTIFHGKKRSTNFDTTTGWATLWEIFAQTYLVTQNDPGGNLMQVLRNLILVAKKKFVFVRKERISRGHAVEGRSQSYDLELQRQRCKNLQRN
jgi:hypothetical protein